MPDGAFARAVENLRGHRDAHDLRIAIAYAFDFRTRMLPFWYADKRMAPCSVRTLGDVLHAAGFQHIRIILQQWTPNFRPSRAVLDGRPLDILLVSAMQVHAEPSYDLIRDAHRMGDARPLILAGGAKAIYEPTDYFELGRDTGVGADCVVTGEAFVLLELLQTILDHRAAGETARVAFERARQSGALNEVLGLVYLRKDEGGRMKDEKAMDGSHRAVHPSSSIPHPSVVAINTGVQRLLRDLDEMPMPDAGYRLLEPPHRGQALSDRPYPPHKVGRRSTIASIIATQGCKFNCPYCPIPAMNQRTWRHKSAERFAAEIKHVYENFGICEFFGTDDNFFNKRETVIALMSELARTTSGGVPLADLIRFYTEGTQFDVYKNRDILPVCRKGGMRAIWFGIEDITGELVKKGQDHGQTAALFALLQKLDMEPMVMMIHSDDQPLRSRNGDLSGLLNQARYVFDIGAVSYQCTYLGPAVGTKDIEPAAKARVLYKAVGGTLVPQAYQDGNHIAASKHPRPWQKQLNILRAYAAFYNPANMLRVLGRMGRDPLVQKRIVFQIVGHIGLVMTGPRLLNWARKLRRGPIEVYDGLIPARIPMTDAATGQEMQWGVEHLPTPDLSGGLQSSSGLLENGQTAPCRAAGLVRALG